MERDIWTQRLRRDSPTVDDTQHRLIDEIKLAFKDWKIYFYMFINAGALTPVYGLSLFLPSIIKDMGYENATAQLLTIPPYVISCLTTIISSWNAGRCQERSNHILLFLVVGIGAFLYLIFMKHTLYFGAVIACIGVFSANALILSWLTNNIVGQTKRAVATAMVICVGNLSGAFSGQIYRSSDQPLYRRGHGIILGLMCTTFVLVCVLKILLTRENRRRKSHRAVGENEISEAAPFLLHEVS